MNIEIVPHDRIYPELQRASTLSSRVWLASPYIGPSARWILSETIADATDRRLLTNIKSGGVDRREMLLLCAWANGNLRTLAGLHAKMFIFDSEAFITSANLSRRAVQSNYEIAVIVRGAALKAATDAFSRLYRLGKPVTATSISTLKKTAFGDGFDARGAHNENYCDVDSWVKDLEVDDSSVAAPTFEAPSWTSDKHDRLITEYLESQHLGSCDFNIVAGNEQAMRRRYCSGSIFDQAEDIGSARKCRRVGAERSIAKVLAARKVHGIGGTVVAFRRLKVYTVTKKILQSARRWNVFKGNPDRFELEAYATQIRKLTARK